MVTQSAPQTDSDVQNELQQILAEIRHLKGLMARDRIEIERLKTESEQLKVVTPSILSSLGVRL